MYTLGTKFIWNHNTSYAQGVTETVWWLQDMQILHSWPLVKGIHLSLVDSTHNGPIMQPLKIFCCGISSWKKQHPNQKQKQTKNKNKKNKQSSYRWFESQDAHVTSLKSMVFHQSNFQHDRILISTIHVTVSIYLIYGFELINMLGAKTGIFWEKKVNVMILDALAPCIAKPSGTISLTSLTSMIYLLPLPFQCGTVVYHVMQMHIHTSPNIFGR